MRTQKLSWMRAAFLGIAVVVVAVIVSSVGVMRWVGGEREASSGTVVGGARDVVRVSGPGVCVARGEGPVKCWGRAPVTIEGTDGVAVLDSGGDVVCGLRPEGGRVMCWRPVVDADNVAVPAGMRWEGETSARVLTQLGSAESIAVAGEFVCGVRNGRARCVDGFDKPVRNGTGRMPEGLPGVRRLVGVGPDSGCALLRSDVLRCWGNDWIDGDHSAPPALSDVVSASRGVATICAVRRDGTVHCSGGGAMGELGPDVSRSEGWHQNPLMSDAVQIDAGSRTVCARFRSGEIRCWGDRGWGALGDGRDVPRHEAEPLPKRVTGIDDATDLTTGCAIVGRGVVKCWGHGPLGNGGTDGSSVPVAVGGL